MLSKLLFFIGVLATATADDTTVDLVTFAGKDKSSTWKWKVLNDVRIKYKISPLMYNKKSTNLHTHIVTACDGRSVYVYLAHQRNARCCSLGRRDQDRSFVKGPWILQC